GFLGNLVLSSLRWILRLQASSCSRSLVFTRNPFLVRGVLKWLPRNTSEKPGGFRVFPFFWKKSGAPTLDQGLGGDFSFVARQKRITVDNEDYYLDLLFFHRRLRRLVACDLKMGKFQAADKG